MSNSFSQGQVTIAYFNYPVSALLFIFSQKLLNNLTVRDEGYSSNIVLRDKLDIDASATYVSIPMLVRF